jgi:hypothetical protein
MDRPDAQPRQPTEPGPLDLHHGPEQLVGRVVEARVTEPHLQGYALLGDLARHYGFAETLYASITGNLPDDRTGAVFQLALMAWTPVTVGDASVHAAIVARVAGSRASAALGAVCVGLAEEANAVVERHAALIEWHARGRHGPVPDCVRAETPDPWVAALLDAARALRIDPTFLEGLDRLWTWDAARLHLVVAAGLDTPERIIAAVMAARFVSAAGETIAQPRFDIYGYPINVPRFQYRDP